MRVARTIAQFTRPPSAPMKDELPIGSHRFPGTAGNRCESVPTIGSRSPLKGGERTRLWEPDRSRAWNRTR